MSLPPAFRNRTPQPLLPLLDRLIDDAPDQKADPPLAATDALAVLRHSVRRDLEALLNARRRWRSWPAHLTELKRSVLGYGIGDFSSGALADPARRERLCAEVEETVRIFEPRFAQVRVREIGPHDPLDQRLRLGIEALLHAEPAPEPVAFEGTIDATTAEVSLRDREIHDDV